MRMAPFFTSTVLSIWVGKEGLSHKVVRENTKILALVNSAVSSWSEPSAKWKRNVEVAPVLSLEIHPDRTSLRARSAPCARQLAQILQFPLGTMNSIVHFEMPYDDPQRMSKFYEKAFGWHTHALGKEMGNYVLAITTESDDNGPKKPGAINGGFYPKKEDWPAQYPTVVIAVDDLGTAMKDVRKAGGEVLGDPMDIPGIGKYVSFKDTEGNRVAMLKPVRGNGKSNGKESNASKAR
jgi:uncharacterized protein